MSALANQEPTKPSPVTPRTGKTILVVDDEFDILESLKMVIENELPGTSVIPCESAQVAFDVMRRQAVHAIVSDFKMPGMNGLDFLIQVRDSTNNIPRILITAYPATGLAVRAINEARVDGMFVKPFDGTRLVQALKSALADRGPRRSV